MSQAQPENKRTSVKEDITPPKSPSPTFPPENRGVSPDIPASERVCIDPALHVTETHTHAHHPGLLKGADFCDIGAPTKEPVLTNLPSSKSDSPDGFMGHSRMVKVRPAFNYHPMNDIVNHNTESVVPYGPSKVRPFNVVPQLEQVVMEQATSLAEDRNPMLANLSAKRKDIAFNVPTAKVRPFDNAGETIEVAETTRFFDAQEKVKPFEDPERDLQVLGQGRSFLQPQPRNDEMNGKQSLDRFPTQRHTICVDDTYPVGQEPDLHNVAADVELAAEPGVPGHGMSQCEEYPRGNDTEIHDVDFCAEASVVAQAENHGISKCHKCAGDTGAREHTTSNCVPFATPVHDSLMSTSRPKADQVRFLPDDRAPSSVSRGTGGAVDTTRSDSLESGYISKNAVQWLRDIIKNPEAYSSKLTNFPGGARTSQQSVPGERRVSEPVRLRENASPRISDLETRVNGIGFKKTVGDLQRLLDEAMAIACQVVDQPMQNTCCEAASSGPEQEFERSHDGSDSDKAVHHQRTSTS